MRHHPTVSERVVTKDLSNFTSHASTSHREETRQQLIKKCQAYLQDSNMHFSAVPLIQEVLDYLQGV